MRGLCCACDMMPSGSLLVCVRGLWGAVGGCGEREAMGDILASSWQAMIDACHSRGEDVTPFFILASPFLPAA